MRGETLTAHLIEHAILGMARNTEQRETLASAMRRTAPVSTPDGHRYNNFYTSTVGTYARVYAEPCFRDYHGPVRGVTDLPGYNSTAFLSLDLHDRLTLMYFKFVYSGESDIHLMLKDLPHDLRGRDSQLLINYRDEYRNLTVPGAVLPTVAATRDYGVYWFFTFLFSIWA